MSLQYLHILNGQPAYFDGRRVTAMTPTSRGNYIVPKLKQARAEIEVSKAWYAERGDYVPKHSWLPVRVKKDVKRS